MKEPDRQEEHEHKRKTHKGICIAQIKFCHGCHPEKGSHKGRDKTWKYEGVMQQAKKKRKFPKKVIGQASIFLDSPLQNELAIHRKEYGSEYVIKTHALQGCHNNWWSSEIAILIHLSFLRDWELKTFQAFESNINDLNRHPEPSMYWLQHIEQQFQIIFQAATIFHIQDIIWGSSSLPGSKTSI